MFQESYFTFRDLKVAISGPW